MSNNQQVTNNNGGVQVPTTSLPKLANRPLPVPIKGNGGTPITTSNGTPTQSPILSSSLPTPSPIGGNANGTGTQPPYPPSVLKSPPPPLKPRAKTNNIPPTSLNSSTGSLPTPPINTTNNTTTTNTTTPPSTVVPSNTTTTTTTPNTGNISPPTTPLNATNKAPPPPRRDYTLNSSSGSISQPENNNNNNTSSTTPTTPPIVNTTANNSGGIGSSIANANANSNSNSNTTTPTTTPPVSTTSSPVVQSTPVQQPTTPTTNTTTTPVTQTTPSTTPVNIGRPPSITTSTTPILIGGNNNNSGNSSATTTPILSSSAPSTGSTIAMNKSNSFTSLPKPEPLQVPVTPIKSTDDHHHNTTGTNTLKQQNNTSMEAKSDKEIKKEEKEKEKREKEERKEKEKLEKKEKKERERIEKEKEREKKESSKMESKKEESKGVLTRGSSSFATKLKNATLTRNLKIDEDEQQQQQFDFNSGAGSSVPKSLINNSPIIGSNSVSTSSNKSISVSNVTPNHSPIIGSSGTTPNLNHSKEVPINGGGSSNGGSNLSIGSLGSSGSIPISSPLSSPNNSNLSISPSGNGVSGEGSPLLGTNGGANRSAIHLDTQRSIMTWGSSSYSKLGFKVNNKEQSQSQPERLPSFNIQDLVSISCGSYFSASLTEDGDVYMWGRGSIKNNPTLGNDQIEDQAVPVKVETLSDIVLISIGFSHSAAVKSNGELLTWGCGEDGQLGHGTFTSVAIPKVIDILTSHWITQVQCGEKHTICLTKNGKVYSWGTSEYGQLGLGDTNKHCSPVLVSALEKYNVIQIASGSTHCAVLTNSKEVLVFGNGVAIGSVGIVTVPMLVPSLRYLHVEKISCGHYSTAALTECGDVYTWGSGEVLGHGSNQNESTPKIVDALRNQSIRQISCGGRHTAFLTDSGRIFTCGKDSFGQLGHSAGDQNKPKKVESLLKTTFLGISCGENHNAVIFDTTRSYRDKFSWKLLETQRTFVRTLDIIQTVYLNPLRVRDRDQLPENQRHLPYIFLSDEEIRSIFGVVEKLYAINSTLLHVINKRFSNWSNKKKLGDVLLNHFKQHNETFNQYISNLPFSINSLDNLTKKQTSPVLGYLKECEKLALERRKVETDDDQKEFTLRALLMEPLNVISRYQKNINGMVKYTKTSHIDYAGLVDLDQIMEEKTLKVQNIINIIQNPQSLASYTTNNMATTNSEDSSLFLKEYDIKIESLQNFRKTCAKIIKSSKKYYEVEPESFKEQGHFSENLSLAKVSFDGFIDPNLVSSLDHFSNSIKKIAYLRSELSTRTTSAFSSPLQVVAEELESYIPLIIEMRKRVLDAHTEYDAAINKLYSLAKNLLPTDKKMLDAEKEVASLKKNLDKTLYEFDAIFKDGVAIQTKSLKLFYACMKAQQEYFERGLQRFQAMKSSFDVLDNFFRKESREKWSKFIYDSLVSVFVEGKNSIPPGSSSSNNSSATSGGSTINISTVPPLELGKDDEGSGKSTLLEPHVILAELEKDDWTFVMDPPTTNEFTDTFIEDQYNQLVELLASPSLQFVQCLISPCHADEQARTIESITRIFETFGRIRPIIHSGIEIEVQSTANPSTLFRSNTIATKLMTSFTKLKGMTYLQKYIIPLVKEIIDNPNGYEVDPSKINEGSEELMTNMMNLIQVSERFTDAIIDSLNGLPLPLREISRYLQKEVISKFPDNKHSSVGGFIFLRFLCPAIIAPFNNGLVDEAPGTEASRALVLIGKVLQNLANGIEFGQKESFMIPVNRFITGNLGRLYSYFDRLTDVPDNKVGDYVITSKEEVQKDIRNIHLLIVKNYPKVIKQLAIHRQKETIGQLSKTIVYLGDPSVMYK